MIFLFVFFYFLIVYGLFQYLFHCIGLHHEFCCIFIFYFVFFFYSIPKLQVNRDTLYVLLNFLHLVAENSEDKKGPQVIQSFDMTVLASLTSTPIGTWKCIFPPF